MVKISKSKEYLTGPEGRNTSHKPGVRLAKLL